MLDINIEFSKGVLFVRLSGKINKNNSQNIEENILNILKKSGIKNLVFNLNDLNILEEIDLFKKCENLIKNNQGKMVICGNNDLNYNKAPNELSALRMMQAC